MAPSAQVVQIEALDCIVVDGGPSPRIAVVICHGYGASYQDLAPLSGEWIRVLGDQADQFRFVFPDAPYSLADVGMPDGRAWWPINMMEMMELMQTAQFDQLHDHEPPGIDQVREILCETINAVKLDLGGDATPLVLGGFSQGAMLALDSALRGPIDPPSVLIQFSSTVACRTQWEAALSRLKDTYVFQSHGTLDPILPYSSATVLHEIFEVGGIANEFHSFVGPHTIDGESVAKTAAAMAKLAKV
jgi:phospholipase/carboxylesterase